MHYILYIIYKFTVDSELIWSHIDQKLTIVSYCKIISYDIVRKLEL